MQPHRRLCHTQSQTPTVLTFPSALPHTHTLINAHIDLHTNATHTHTHTHTHILPSVHTFHWPACAIQYTPTSTQFLALHRGARALPYAQPDCRADCEALHCLRCAWLPTPHTVIGMRNSSRTRKSSSSRSAHLMAVWKCVCVCVCVCERERVCVHACMRVGM